MGESSAQLEGPLPKPSRFQFVPVPGEFTRGRWKCRDSYHPYAETLEFEKNKTKEEANPDKISVSFKLRQPKDELDGAEVSSTIQVTSVENNVNMSEEANNSSESIIITRKNGVTIVRKTSATLAPDNYDKIRELSIDDFESKQGKDQQVPPTPMNTPPATMVEPVNADTLAAAKPKIFQVQTVIDSVPTRKFSDTEAVHKVTEALENVPQSATVPAQKPRHFHVAPVVDDPKFSQTTTTVSAAVSLKDEPTFQVIQTEESKNMSMDSVKNVIESTQNEPLGNVLETAANVQITVSAELQKKEVVREATGSVGSLEACGIPIACPPTAPHSTPYGTPKDTQRSPTFDEAFAGGVSEGQNQNQNETEKTSMTDSGTISVISQETPPSSSSLTDKVETNGALTASPSAATIPVSVNVEPSLPIDNKIEQAMELVKTHLTYAVREEVDTLRNTIADLEYQMREYQFECNFYRQNCPPETVEQATAFVRQQMTKLQPPARRAVSTTSAPSMEGIQQATANPTSSTHMRNLQTQIQQIKQIVPVAIVPKPSSLTNSSTTPSSTQNDQSDSQ